MPLTQLQKNQFNDLWKVPGKAFRWLLMQYRLRLLDDVTEEQIWRGPDGTSYCPFDATAPLLFYRSELTRRFSQLEAELRARVETSLVGLLREQPEGFEQFKHCETKKDALKFAAWLSEQDCPFDPVALSVHAVQTGLLSALQTKMLALDQTPAIGPVCDALD